MLVDKTAEPLNAGLPKQSALFRAPRAIIMQARGSRAFVLPLLFGLVLVLAWEFWTNHLKVSSIVLPPPGAVFDKLWESLPLLSEQGYRTATASLMALLISSLIGVSTGILLTISHHLKSAVFPNVVFFELIPKIALAPLFVIWFGTGIELRLAFAVFLSLFPVLLATMAGLVATDASVLRLCRAANASVLQTLFLVRLPYAAPYVFSGIKVASTMAMIGVVVAEFLTGNSGLGYMIMFAATNLETSLMLASMLLLCVFGMVLFWSVELVERLLAKRYGVPGA